MLLSACVSPSRDLKRQLADSKTVSIDISDYGRPKRRAYGYNFIRFQVEKRCQMQVLTRDNQLVLTQPKSTPPSGHPGYFIRSKKNGVNCEQMQEGLQSQAEVMYQSDFYWGTSYRFYMVSPQLWYYQISKKDKDISCTRVDVLSQNIVSPRLGDQEFLELGLMNCIGASI